VRIVRVALLLGLLLAAMLDGAREAAAECPKPRGKPMYRVTRGPIVKPPRGEKPQTTVFSVFATGRWTLVAPGESTTGCIGPLAMKELSLALSKARWRVARGVVTTCRALPTERVTYAWLRKGRRITTDEPCGIPIDERTATLARCAEEAARETPPPIDELRAICRGEE
jgi:hypothetical protein